MKGDRHFPDIEPVTRGGRGSRVRGVDDEGVAEESFAFLRRRRSSTDDAAEIVEPLSSIAVESLTTGEEELTKQESVPDVAQAKAVARNSSEKKLPKENWLKRRGHALSYMGLFLFTAVLYFRPYELIPALESFKSVAFWIAIATLVVFFPTQLMMEGNLSARPRELSLLLLLGLAALLSIPTAINPKEAWDTFNDAFIKAVLMFVVMINVVRTKWRLRGLLLLAISVSVYLSVKALGDYQSGNLTVEGYRVAGSIGGMFGNPNDMALHLVTILPITLALMFSTRGPLRKLIYVTCALLMVAAIVVTFSRGGFLAMAGIVGVLGWKIGRKHRLAVMLALVVFLVGFSVLAPGSYGDRMGSIFNHSLDAVGSASMRQEILIRSIVTTLRHPLFGIGMGNFHIVSIRELVSHNAYTQVSAELGIPAMIIYVMFMITPFKRLREIERETLDSRSNSRFYYMSIGLQASIVGYMIGSFFASVAYLWYVYYLVGYAICLRRMYQIAQEESEKETEAVREYVVDEESRISQAKPLAEAVLR